jgi:hypothetical protein
MVHVHSGLESVSDSCAAAEAVADFLFLQGTDGCTCRFKMDSVGFDCLQDHVMVCERTNSAKNETHDSHSKGEQDLFFLPKIEDMNGMVVASSWISCFL